MENSYYKTKESVEEYIKMCENDEPTVIIPQFLSFINSKTKILEIGSGIGIDWKFLNQTHTIIGSDSSLEFVTYLKTKFQTGEFLVLDAITLETPLSFQAIYSNKVLHYLNTENLLQSIKKQAQILDSNGIICHTFWEGEGSDYFKGLYLQYHKTPFLKQLFGEYFEILILEYYTEYEENDSILLIGRKK